MIQTGLVSVTFRDLTPRAIVDLVAKAALDAIEWGGDVHVPHGEIATARTVRQMTADAGLAMPSYGSYYRVGHGDQVPFEAVVESALTLGTPIIRVWAGKQGSAADAAYWERIIADSIRCADLAAAAGLGIAYEYHGNTLTDTDAAAVRLLTAVDHPAVTTYWQPREHATVEQNLAGLAGILPWLSNVHIQAWQPSEASSDGGSKRAPLAAMSETWSRWLVKAATAPGDHAAMLEFVADDAPEQFLADAEALKGITEEYRM